MEKFHDQSRSSSWTQKGDAPGKKNKEKSDKLKFKDLRTPSHPEMEILHKIK